MTVMVCTRLADGRLRTIYCNELDRTEPDAPYVATITVSAESLPVGLERDELPAVGETRVVTR